MNEVEVRRIVQRMVALLTHRGPDGAAVKSLAQNESAPIVFGHCRLSIIDAATGAQPMYSNGGQSVITFNGEIFNYLELREELRRLGSNFTTESDTEVILEAFQWWGVSAFDRLNGQFAFALYDLRDRSLYLVRDRMGEKPLYYYRDEQFLVFASEVKAIVEFLRARAVPVELNSVAFGQYLSLNYVPFDVTLVKGIHKLAPGHCFKVVGKEIVSIPFSEPPIDFSFSCAIEQSLETFRVLLESASELRMRSDVPVGIFLSGGIDSSSIAVALKSRGLRPKAFIADFEQSTFSEAPKAIAVCRDLDLPYDVIPIRPAASEFPRLIDQLVSQGDEPLADSSSLPVYLLSRETARQVKVVLSGDGGDELFAGYLTYRATSFASRLPHFVRQVLYRGTFLAHMLPAGDRKVGLLEKLDRFLRNLDLPPGAAHFAWNGTFRLRDKLKLLAPELLSTSGLNETFCELADRLNVSRETPQLKQLMLADQRSYLLNDILVKSDRMSMAHGLEARPVFMDYRLVQYSRLLDERLLLQGGEGKLIPRAYLRKYAPWYQLAGPKLGFSIPVHLWFRTILKDLISDLFHSRWVAEAGLFDQRALIDLLNRHLARRANLGFELWGLMVVLLWHRKFITNVSPEV
jgi:asparagine synthase (glutamine-hydrolysing)